jgi:hypothetical protein
LAIALRASTIASLLAPLRSKRRFLDLITDTVGDVTGSIGIDDDTVKRFPHLAKVWGLLVQEIQCRKSIVARGGDRLRDFLSQRGCQFSHLPRGVHVGEIVTTIHHVHPLFGLKPYPALIRCRCCA